MCILEMREIKEGRTIVVEWRLWNSLNLFFSVSIKLIELRTKYMLRLER